METQISIYAAEIEANIHGDIIAQAQAGVTHEAVCAIIDKAINPKALLEEVKPLDLVTADDQMSFANMGEHCMPFSSILCSDIWNKNGDVFTAGELIDTYRSAQFQPINWQHHGSEARGNENIGVMVQSSLLKGNIDSLEPFEDADLLDLHSSNCSAQVHIRQDGIIWAYYFPSYASSIVAGIEENNLFVSMECFYKNFGYALRLSENDSDYILLKRDQSNAHLTAHLKAHRGSGSVLYQGINYQIGRWLQGSSFSGQGIVNKPANVIGGTKLSIIFAETIGKKKKKTKNIYSDDSKNVLREADVVSGDGVTEIKSVPDSVSENSGNLNNNEENGYISTEGFSNKGEKTMTEAEFNDKLAKANEARDAALAQVAQLQESALKAEVDKLTALNADLKTENGRLEAAATDADDKLDTVEGLEVQIKTLTEDNEAIQAKLDEIAAEAQGKDRMAKLAKLVPEAYGDDDFEDVRDMSAETFAALEKGLTKAGVSSLAKLTDQGVSGQSDLTDQGVSGVKKLTEAAHKDDKKDKAKTGADAEIANAIADSKTNKDEESDVQVPAEASEQDAEANKQRGRDLVRHALRR